MTTTTKTSSTRRRRRRTHTGRFSCNFVVVVLLLLVVIIFQSYNEYYEEAQEQLKKQQLSNDAAISPRNKENDVKYIPKLVICGTVYNVQQHLPAIQKSIMRLVANNTFDLVHLLFANHNSTDDSVRHLEQWSTQLSKNVTVFSLASSSNDNDDDDDEPFKQRTVRLAQARNFLWQQVSLLSRGSATVSSNNSYSGKSSNTGSQIDYVLMMDMDDVNWHLSNVYECLNLPPYWTVCCCNSYKVYYDLWALRTFDGDDDIGISNNNRPNKNWLAVTAGSKSSQGTTAAAAAAGGGFGRHRHSKPFRHIPAGHEPIPVKSCFGGAALYRYTNQDLVMVANSNPYVGMMKMMEDDDTRNNNSSNSSIHKKGKKHPVCEHVSFHLQLYARNQSLYIQPSFLNDGPSDERMLYFGAVKKRLEPEYTRSWEETPLYYQHFWD